MKFFSRLFETKQSRALRIMRIDGEPKAAWSSRNYKAFSTEGYQYNVIASSAIKRIADAVATIDWIVRDGDKKVKQHPLIDLFSRPNPMQNGAEWWRTRISYLLLSGNSYLERSTVDNRVVELWPLRPDRMVVAPGRGGIPAYYEYQQDGQKLRFSVDPVTGDSDIRHTKLFHPTDDWYGMSPIESAAYAIDQHNEAMQWVQALLQNSARPSGALIVDAENPLSDDEFNRLKKEVEDKYSGSRNAGRPMLLEGGMDWKQMGLSPMDMEILRLKESAARDISLAFGVPPLLLNIPGDNTYSNYREARLGFYEDTIIPFITYELEEMNAWLSPFFGGARIEPDLDSIEALAEKRQKLWKMADESFDITLNESRKMKGLDPLPEPLGSTLMAEIKKGPAEKEDPAAGEAVDNALKEAARVKSY